MKRSKLSQACFPISTFLFLLIISSTAFARADELPKGTVIERVVCDADPTQNYALYLPSSYTPQAKWPVIYAFDPDGRGDMPVRLYRNAAEKYGYIVAGSYNTQNGMQSAPLQTAISTMIADTHKRFSIDEKRVYTTGFSGGARIATRVASSCGGCIAGVIACGAGFPPDIKPTAGTPFVFYGTVGVDDFNYPELKRLDDTLDRAGIPHRIATFSGGHEWASTGMLVEALEWVEIQAMRAGRRTRDDAFVDAQWKKGIENASANESARKLYDAYESYDSLVNDFKGLKDLTDCERRLRDLKQMKEVKLAIKDEQQQLQEQLELTTRVIDLGAMLLTDPSKRSGIMKELRVVIEALRVKAKAAEDSRQRRIARRSVRQILAQTYEAAMFNYLPRQQYDVALINLEVAGLVVPDSWEIPYDMARAYSLSGEKKKALEALRHAVEKGLTDSEIIENQKDFDGLRSEIDFKSIITQLKLASPSK